MPNKIKRDKRDKYPVRRRKRRVDSVKDLLQGPGVALARLKEQQEHQALWRGWLDAHLPEEARVRVCGVVERAGTLVIFASSAAWSARVRFAVAEIEAELKRAHPGIGKVAVRVLPR
jgi:hypothetical protein